jgi:hypothetical protein
MDPEGSLPHSQQPATWIYPKSVEFRALHHIRFLQAPLYHLHSHKWAWLFTGATSKLSERFGCLRLCFTKFYYFSFWKCFEQLVSSSTNRWCLLLHFANLLAYVDQGYFLQLTVYPYHNKFFKLHKLMSFHLSAISVPVKLKEFIVISADGQLQEVTFIIHTMDMSSIKILCKSFAIHFFTVKYYQLSVHWKNWQTGR